MLISTTCIHITSPLPSLLRFALCCYRCQAWSTTRRALSSLFTSLRAFISSFTIARTVFSVLLQVPSVVNHAAALSAAMRAGSGGGVVGGGGDDERKALQLTHFELSRLRAVMRGLSVIATGSVVARRFVRASSLSHLLFSCIGDVQVRSATVAM
jgi:hypothetical protein